MSIDSRVSRNKQFYITANQVRNFLNLDADDVLQSAKFATVPGKTGTFLVIDVINTNVS